MHACRRSVLPVGLAGETRHQSSRPFPRLPGIIPAVFSAFFFSPPHCDCSIKEHPYHSSNRRMSSAILGKPCASLEGEPPRGRGGRRHRSNFVGEEFRTTE